MALFLADVLGCWLGSPLLSCDLLVQVEVKEDYAEESMVRGSSFWQMSLGQPSRQAGLLCSVGLVTILVGGRTGYLIQVI